MPLTLAILLSLVALSQCQPPFVPKPYWGWPFENLIGENGREYSNLTGYGNNKAHPEWGTANIPYLRHSMPAKYYTGPIDPINDPNGPTVQTNDGIDPTLPNIRLVGNKITDAVGKHVVNDVFINQIHLDWGHLITTDLIHTTTLPNFARTPYSVIIDKPPFDTWWDHTWGDAPNRDPVTGAVTLPTCALKEPFDFAVCGREEKGAYLFVNRMFPAPGTGPGSDKPKEQVVEVTQYLDLSQIYGTPTSPNVLFFTFESDPWFEVDPNTKRLQNWGKFPIDKDSGYAVVLVPNSDIPPMWKAAGDYRFNKTPGLRVLMLLFMLEHNSIIDGFLANATTAQWSNETMFFEARRKTIAIYQSITFREYLAAATGAPAPPYTGYKPDVNVGIDVFFASVAMRYGHSALPQFVPFLDNNFKSCPFGGISQAEVFFPGFWTTPDPENPFFDPVTGQNTTEMRRIMDHACIVRGLSHSAANMVDLGFIDEVRNTFGQSGGPRHGDDLITWDILRSRDNGLPSYNEARAYFNLSRVNSFAELVPHNKALQHVLEELYGNIDRLDAYIGAMAEPHEANELGPLNVASMREQFGRLRDGDRFFFENPEQFTQEEINEIHTTKLRDLFLKHYPNITEGAIPTNAFYLNQRQLASYIPTNIFPDPIPNLAGLPWTTKELVGVYRLHWAIDREADPQEITFQIQVQTDGWAGIGWRPDNKGSMKGADIALCRITDEVAECRDSKALDVGIPLLDADVGGSSGFWDLNISRTNGILTAMFTRFVVPTDPQDNEITDDLRIIFAFNPYSNELIYHGPTRFPDQVINFLSDYKGPAKRISITPGILIFLYVIAAVGSLLSFFYIGLVLMKKEYFRFQTPEFCILVSVGSLLGYASVFLLLPDSQNNATCKAHIWLFGMSFWIVFLGFFIKVARVYYIVKKAEKTLEIAVLPFWQLLLPLAICMLGETLFNILWDTLIPPDLSVEEFEKDNTYILYCAGIWYMWLISVVTKAIFLGIGVILAYLTQRLPQELNWTREIGSVIYTMAIVLFIGIPLGFALQSSSTMVVLLKGILICIAYIAVTLIIHFDSLKRVIVGKEPREQTRTGNTIKTTKATSSSKV